MKSLRGLVGLSVIRDGKRIGRVVRGVLSRDRTRMTGIWVEEGFYGTRFIPSEHIEVLGDVSVLTDSRGRRGRCGRGEGAVRAVSTSGARIGAVTDWLIDEVTFSVSAVEVTGGILEELLRGRYVTRAFREDPASRRVIVGENEKRMETGSVET